ncbi:MAG TPA: trigger factor family protein, partial [Candidatus Paceibacterota bacterium]|nr:trigger factor family protein [Candidatus Paceibacterota bacterium]
MQFEALAKNFARKNLPDSEVEFVGEIPADTLLPYRGRALSRISSELELPGFRKGKVPEDLVLKKVGELPVLEEAVNLFVRDFYPELVEGQKVDVVGRPQVVITKLAPGNPVGLTIRTALYPEVSLPRGYKTTGESVPLEPALPATDEETAQTLESLRQSRKKDNMVPELNDEFAKSVGAFENLDALKEQIRKGIGEEKVR